MAFSLKHAALGAALILLALLLGVSLLSYDRWDPSLFTYTSRGPTNLVGSLGSFTADVAVSAIGIAAYPLALVLLALGVKLLLGMEVNRTSGLGAALFLVSLSLLAELYQDSFGGQGAGGMLGHFLASLLTSTITVAGAYLLTIAALLSSIVLMSPGWVIDKVLSPKEPETEAEVAEAMLMPEPEPVAEPEATPVIEAEAEPEHKPGALAGLISMLKGKLQKQQEEAEEAEEPVEIVLERASEVEGVLEVADGSTVLAVQPPHEVVSPATGSAASPKADTGKSKYKLPSLDILNTYDPAEKQTEADLKAAADLLVSKLGDFNVKGRVLQVHTGPIITMYEFEPAPGVKINRVVSLADDLALAMRAQSIRISAVPGKSAMGIEIPNRNREKVALKEILVSEGFKSAPSRLTVAMGKDIFGKPVVADLARMPHLLVAGATGSGKSVFMNSLVMSLLYKAKPEEVRMLMIDPKLLELSSYDGIPHLLAPVVTGPKEASEMLRRMVFEMERRYRLIADLGVRNIDSFNAACPPEQRLPFIVIFIDELADLMLASSAQVEDSIARLAQMARAAGMHLIVATQRPSVDVITGVIKANFPARVAFQVTTKVDSRTIIDAMGAEQLIGRGDMLFMLPGAKLLRVHGALVTEAEVNSAVEHVRSQGVPDYALLQEIVQAEEAAKSEEKDNSERDDLFWKAVEHAEALGEVSISSVQRKLKVGYNRAARIMDLMEEDGMVGPPKGAGKPRDFLGRGGAA